MGEAFLYGQSGGSSKILRAFEPGFVEKVYKDGRAIPEGVNSSLYTTTELLPKVPTRYSIIDKESSLMYQLDVSKIITLTLDGDFVSSTTVADPGATSAGLIKINIYGDLLVLTGAYSVFILNKSDMTLISSAKVPTTIYPSSNSATAIAQNCDSIIIGNKLYTVTKNNYLHVYDLETNTVVYSETTSKGTGEGTLKATTSSPSYDFTGGRLEIDDSTGELYSLAAFGYGTGFTNAVISVWSPLDLQKNSTILPTDLWTYSEKSFSNSGAANITYYNPYFKKNGNFITAVQGGKIHLYVREGGAPNTANTYTLVFSSSAVTEMIIGGLDLYQVDEQVTLVNSDHINVIHSDLLPKGPDDFNTNLNLKFLRTAISAPTEFFNISGVNLMNFTDGINFKNIFNGGASNVSTYVQSNSIIPKVSRVVDNVIDNLSDYVAGGKDPYVLVNDNYYVVLYVVPVSSNNFTFRVVKIDKKTGEKSYSTIEDIEASSETLLSERFAPKKWAQTAIRLHGDLLIFSLINNLYIYDIKDFSLKLNITPSTFTASDTNFLHFDVYEDRLSIKSATNYLIAIDLNTFTEKWKILVPTNFSGTTMTRGSISYILQDGNIAVYYSTGGWHKFSWEDGGYLGPITTHSTDALYLRNDNIFLTSASATSEAWRAIDASTGLISNPKVGGVQISAVSSMAMNEENGVYTLVSHTNKGSTRIFISTYDPVNNYIRTQYFFVDPRQNSPLHIAQQIHDGKLVFFNKNNLYEYDLRSLSDRKVKILKGFKLK